MAGEFLQSFFHQIPNGITLIFALSSLAAGALAMAKRHHHNRFYTFFWWAIIFMVMWRSFKGIISIRYAALLIYPAAAVIAVGCCRIGTWLRFFRGYYPRLPRRFCDVAPALLVAAAAGGCLAISWYKLTASTPVYRTIYATIRAWRERDPGIRVIVKSDDAARITYYTKVPSIPVEGNERTTFFRVLNGVTAPNRNFLLVVKEAGGFDLLDHGTAGLRPGARVKQLEYLKGRKRKRKDLNIYLYENPLTLFSVRGAPPKLPAAREGLPDRRGFAAHRSGCHFRSRQVAKGGDFRFTFLVRSRGGKKVHLNVGTVVRKKKGEARQVQFAAFMAAPGLYCGNVTFSAAGPFAVDIRASAPGIVLEQCTLARMKQGL